MLSKCLLIGLLFNLASVCIFCQGNYENPLEIRQVIAKDGLRLRESPSLSAQILDVLQYNAHVSILEKQSAIAEISGISGSWCRISQGWREGWVFGGFLSRESAGFMPAFFAKGTRDNSLDYVLRMPEGGFACLARSGNDYFLSMINSEGVILWKKRLPVDNRAQLFLVNGIITVTFPTYDNKSLVLAVYRYKADGTFIDERKISLGISGYQGYTISHPVRDGFLVVMQKCSGPNTVVLCDLVIKIIDMSGNTKWAREYDSNGTTYFEPLDVTVLENNIYCISLRVEDGLEFFSFDEAGNQLSEKRFKPPAILSSVCLMETPDHGLFSASLKSNFDGHTTRYGLFLQLTDKSGRVVWQKNYDKPGYKYRPSAVLRFNKGGFIVCGERSIEQKGLASDVFILILSENGKVLEERTYNWDSYDFPVYAVFLENGKLLIVLNQGVFLEIKL
jgi:hypothetical protein